MAYRREGHGDDIAGVAFAAIGGEAERWVNILGGEGNSGMGRVRLDRAVCRDEGIEGCEEESNGGKAGEMHVARGSRLFRGWLVE